MRILTCLTYYDPYLSGLSIYARRVAEALAARGHTVTVLTGRHDDRLPEEQHANGVVIRRVPVSVRVGKGLVMPRMPLQAWRGLRNSDVLHLHLPQLDAAYLTTLAKLRGVPTVITYHCDLSLPRGVMNALAGAAMATASRIAVQQARAVVVNTVDYAEHSHLLRTILHKAVQVLPPAQVSPPRPDDRVALIERAQIRPGDRIIGIVGRLAAEKGVDVLASALPMIRKQHPTARVLHAGAFTNVPGESAYLTHVTQLTKALGAAWQFLGPLPDGELAAVYELSDVTVLPSTNSTESFGMVQVESMLCGTPVVASALPGVRVPIEMTGMGQLVAPNDPLDLACAISTILKDPRPGRPAILDEVSPASVACRYEEIFNTHIRGRRRKG